jgi:hypothetical protein
MLPEPGSVIGSDGVAISGLRSAGDREDAFRRSINR